MPDLTDDDDEQILDAGKLPLELEPEMLYYFDAECNNSKPLGYINMRYHLK